MFTFVTMSDKSKDIAKELEQIKQKSNDAKIKQAIEDKQKYVNKPVFK